ncbi:MAG: hypothetical protein JXD18_08165 [Anaerolineae bacterium]|nr:hypothetical protein [Anaerolineae bacterium]
MDGKTYFVREGTQLVLDHLKVGVGNLMRSNESQVTAMLWLLAADEQQRVRVYAGREVVWGGCRIRVAEIGLSGGRGFVRLAVDPVQ